MLVTDAIDSIPGWAWPILVLVAIFSWAGSVRYQKGFNKYNGPFLASFTNFWRIWQRLRYPHRTYFQGVAKYGRIIRVGPNTLVFNDPEAIKDIYMTQFSKVSCRSSLFPAELAVLPPWLLLLRVHRRLTN